MRVSRNKQGPQFTNFFIFSLSRSNYLPLNLASIIALEREKEFELVNTSLRDQLKELQERLDDTDNQQLQNKVMALEQAGMSRTSSESQNRLCDNSDALQNDFQVKTEKIAVLLDKCEGIEYNIK